MSRLTRAARTLDAMDAITLDEMDAATLMNRTDTKFVFATAQLDGMLNRIAGEYRVLDVEGVRCSAYRTLYFDTPAHACFVEHHNGKLNRRKYRMREYESSGACFLEIKLKDNKGRTNKRRIPIDRIEERMTTDATEFIRAATGELLDLTPQLWTRFRRITLVHTRLRERVTLDTEIGFGYGGRAEELPNVVIAEVKQDRDDRHSAVREQFRCERIRPMRVSKYCLGSMLLKPELKANRFKAKLRAIRSLC